MAMVYQFRENSRFPEQVVNLFNTAGFAVGIGEWRPEAVGIGEWRPEKDGSYGLFHVAGQGE